MSERTDENQTQKGQQNMDENAKVENQATEETTDLEALKAEIEALKAENEKEKAEKQRFKNSLDKTLKENAEKKRAERAKLSEEERLAEERAEEFERLKAEKEAAANELNHLRAVTAYKTIEPEMIEKMISAVNDKDHNAIAGYIDKIVEKAIKEKEAEWKKSRPDAVIGNGAFPSMTKDEILAIKDEEEAVRQIALHKDLFK